MEYGDVVPAGQLTGGALPGPRGPLTGWLFDVLGGDAGGAVPPMPKPADDVLDGDDAALALYCLYELHYRGFAGVCDDWEWNPALLTARASLEREFEARLREGLPACLPSVDVRAHLLELCAGGDDPQPNSLSGYLAEDGSFAELREFAIHRSAYQLKEADPHTWALPRLTGAAKAALLEIQADEYGAAAERDMHQNLFAVTMSELGLDVGYNAYLGRLPGVTLAPVNLVSFLGLHRRLRGALVGHLAVFEMTSVEPMGRYSNALRRHGCSASARHFYDTHVVADAHHRTVALDGLVAGLLAQEPELAPDVLFGAEALTAVESTFSAHLMRCWKEGRSSLIEPAAGVPPMAVGL